MYIYVGCRLMLQTILSEKSSVARQVFIRKPMLFWVIPDKEIRGLINYYIIILYIITLYDCMRSDSSHCVVMMLTISMLCICVLG